MVYDFGLRLKQLRKTAGLTQDQVAVRLHLTRGTISSYENNTICPSVPILEDLALLYRTSTDYMLNLDKRHMISIDGLTREQEHLIRSMIKHLKKANDKAKLPEEN